MSTITTQPVSKVGLCFVLLLCLATVATADITPYRSAGFPRLLGCDPIDIRTFSDRTTAQITIKNTGYTDGSFVVRITECSEGASPPRNEIAQRWPFDAREERTLDLPLIVWTSESMTTTGVCAVEAYDAYVPDVKQKCTFTFTVRPPECAEGARRCAFVDREESIVECVRGEEILFGRCLGNRSCVETGDGEVACELHPTTTDRPVMDQVTKDVLGILAFFLSLIGIILVVIHLDKKRKENIS